ncbi:glycosyltransferase family 25 protein [Neisseria leonii]|uniref:Glycosyltransferase family 25 protein n=1 Tax=Neisseria leonii TaxID=2995413 RepID=A0A9X4E2N6_9NEIS|nr:glycosyltransferase family 25 protein [Neisseria sp. 51.81]MDD9328492.1 glycosyltransferase family 25 protein [Neisseria sp. 51.81]
MTVQIPTYVVSLAGETVRRAHIAEECSKFGIRPVFVDACDMRGIGQEDLQSRSCLPEHKQGKKKRWLKPGELGCALSHLQVYRRMLEQQEEYALILEDDAMFIRDPRPLLDTGRLKALRERVPFDVLIVGYVKTLPQYLPYYYRRIPLKRLATFDLNGETACFGTPWAQYGCGTVAYIATRSAAQKLLNVNTPPRVAADDWLYFEQHGKVRVIHSRPAFVLEALEKLRSTIRCESLGDCLPKWHSWAVRSVKGWVKYFILNYIKKQ